MQSVAYKNVSEKILEDLLSGEKLSLAKLPLLKSSSFSFLSSSLSISFLCKFRIDVIPFAQEMLCKWLIPGEKLFFETFFSARFREDYLLVEGVIPISSEEMGESIERNLPILLEEIRLGLISRYHARSMLEIKGLSSNEKKGLVREKISALVEKFPSLFDADIFTLMQQYLIAQSEEFIEARSGQLLTRIINTLYFFTQKLSLAVEEAPLKRHVEVKVIRAKGESPFGLQERLGFFIGINFLKEREVFEKRHLLKIVRRTFPSIEILEGSYFVQSDRGRRFLVLYVEMEGEGEFFEQKDIVAIQKELALHLNGCIEGLVRPIFMPRNEEEVLKYSVTLSSQIKALKDLPQVVIMFDEQTDSDLFFTVVIARILFAKSKRMDELFQIDSLGMSTRVEKVRKLGFVRKKFPKEISVLNVRLASAAYLREDYSVDLYRARSEVNSLLSKILGDVRDYNGGMIAKQREVFHTFKDLFEGGEEESILEGFFHSIYPAELRVVTPVGCLKIFYHLFDGLRASDKQKEHIIVDGTLYVCMKFFDRNVMKFQNSNAQLIKLDLSLMQSNYMGFIFFGASSSEQEIFLETIEEIISRDQI